MPVTRRQSGKLPSSELPQDKSRKSGKERKANVEDEYSSDIDEITESDDGSSDDSGSEWGKSSRKSGLYRLTDAIYHNFVGQESHL
jgi:hypothetical protein